MTHFFLAHCVTFHPSNKFFYISDLGIDKVIQYSYDSASGKVSMNLDKSLEIEKGQGPRHFVFHPLGLFGYVINELLSSITVVKFDSQVGQLSSIQTISTLPPNYQGSSTCAAIEITPNGKFVYASNRGYDSLAIFKVNPNSGLLEFVDHCSTGGEVPRDFRIDPSGSIILVANQNTDNIRAYFIDKETGKLTFTGKETKVYTPVCIQFAKILS